MKSESILKIYSLVHLKTIKLTESTTAPNINWNISPKGNIFKEIIQQVILTIDKTYNNPV